MPKVLIAVLLLAATCSRNATAQWNILTYREARHILESIPEIRTAQPQPRCQPVLDRFDETDPNTVSFQARLACGDVAGQLIGNYTVNRRTGIVTTWGDNPRRLGDNKTKSLAKQLVAEAKSRALSAKEAKCLSLVAARTLPGWAEPGQVSVEEPSWSGSRRDSLDFEARFVSKDRPVRMYDLLTVDVGTGEVRRYASEQKLLAGGPADLASKLFSLKVSPALTDEDAVSLVLALRISTFVDGLRNGCRLLAGLPSRWDNTLVGLDCDSNTGKGAALAVEVNIITGEVNNFDTGQRLETPESEQFLKELWVAKKARLIQVRAEVANACQDR